MHRRLILLPLLIASLLACNLSASMSREQVATLAAATIEAVNATRAAQAIELPTEAPPPPTETPIPGSPTPVPPSPTPGIAGCTDIAGFVADVTIPDDTAIDAGDGFVKTWRLRNNGTCTWTSSYSLVFDHGDKMGGADAQPLPGAVAPGNTVDLSVNLTAPNTAGTYQGFWKLRNNAGVLFGLAGNQAFWVRIAVPGTPTPTATGLVFNPGIIITILPLIYTSSGTDAALASDACFDLDTGVPVGCGSASADFRYQVTFVFPTFNEEIQPLHGAEFRYFGNPGTTPTSADCQALALGSGSFDANVNTYCYRTSNGKYGFLRVDSAALTMQFDWGTYTFP